MADNERLVGTEAGLAELKGKVSRGTLYNALQADQIEGAYKANGRWQIPLSAVWTWLRTPELHKRGVKKGTKRRARE